MAVRTQEELINQFSTIIGEDDTRDEVLNFMTDMRDTLADSGQETIAALRQQVTDTENTWRKKYRDAFRTANNWCKRRSTNDSKQ